MDTKKLKPVLTRSDIVIYVSEHTMAKFVEKNSTMDADDVTDFIREVGISSNEGGQVYWVKEDVFSKKKIPYYNQQAIEWMQKFFEAHSDIEKIMVVFDN